MNPVPLRRSLPRAVFVALRPKQWIKNVLVAGIDLCQGGDTAGFIGAFLQCVAY